MAIVTERRVGGAPGNGWGPRAPHEEGLAGTPLANGVTGREVPVEANQ
jgi:hypothetical protein